MQQRWQNKLDRRLHISLPVLKRRHLSCDEWVHSSSYIEEVLGRAKPARDCSRTLRWAKDTKVKHWFGHDWWSEATLELVFYLAHQSQDTDKERRTFLVGLCCRHRHRERWLIAAVWRLWSDHIRREQEISEEGRVAWWSHKVLLNA